MGQLHFHACALKTKNNYLTHNYINLAAKENVWELLLRNSFHTNKHTYGRFKKTVMGNYENRCQARESNLKVAGEGKEACSVKRTTDKSAKPNTCKRAIDG